MPRLLYRACCTVGDGRPLATISRRGSFSPIRGSCHATPIISCLLHCRRWAPSGDHLKAWLLLSDTRELSCHAYYIVPAALSEMDALWRPSRGVALSLRYARSVMPRLLYHDLSSAARLLPLNIKHDFRDVFRLIPRGNIIIDTELIGIRNSLQTVLLTI